MGALWGISRVTDAVDRPQALGGFSYYFGWRVVAALFLSTLALFGVSIYSFIMLAQPMAREFGWSAAQSGSLVSAMWLVAPLALFAGPVTARVRPWRLVIAGLCIQAVAMLILGQISELWQLYLLRIFMGFGKVMTASAAPLIVAQWFSRRFATAVALVWAGGAAGGFVLSPLTGALCDGLGWRSAALVIAAGTFAAAAVVALLARGPAAPRNLGLDLDGIALSDAAPAHGAKPRPAATWLGGLGSIHPVLAILMFLSVTAAGMTSIAAQAQQPAFLHQVGLSAQVAATILGLTAAGALAGSASIGWVLDRFRGWVGALIVAASIYGGLLTLGFVLTNPGVIPAALGGFSLGYGFGAGEVLWITFTKRRFGEAAFPLTYGGWYCALQVGYALGGGAGGWALERLGAGGLLLLLALLYLTPTLASLLVSTARQPAPARR